ncbi:MAG TPA: winged helix-turn-helix transcriptional regulator [Tabrizicola sp.]|jgi:DNA-binding HxlR family transcriptional regulator
MLEAEGLVTRTAFPTAPPTEYAVTELGRRMGPVIQAMAAFGAALQSR